MNRRTLESKRAARQARALRKYRAVTNRPSLYVAPNGPRIPRGALKDEVFHPYSAKLVGPARLTWKRNKCRPATGNREAVRRLKQMGKRHAAIA